MALRAKSVLWVDDESDLLESHRIFLRSKGYDVECATNADDAVELLRRRTFDLLLLDEQMPGTRGLEAYREVREIAPNLPVVMVTKSEEDSTLREAIGANIRDYLVKPVNPRQVLSVITRILEGPRIRPQAIARAFVERFRALELDRARNLDWRGWIERYDELMRWDVDLAEADERGLYDSLQGLYSDMHREFADYMETAYPGWLANLSGERPPLSIDIVGEFLMPILERERAAVFIVVDCLRLDQWRILEPLLAPYFDVETTHYYACFRRRRRTRAIRCSADCFPARSRRAIPNGGARRTTSRSTRTSASFSRRTSASCAGKLTCVTRRSRPLRDRTISSATWGPRSRRKV